MTETKRVRRTPINGLRNKIPTVKNPDPDFVYRYVYDNGLDNRVETFKEVGYEVVDNKTTQVKDDRRVADASTIGSIVTVPSGANKLILMRQKRQYYEEDQLAKKKEVDKLEDSMKAPSDGLTGKVSVSRD